MDDPEASGKKKERGKGKETLFRVAYRNQVNLIQIADNKANIIISINTMIISSIIAISGYGMVSEKIAYDKTTIIIPITVIVLSCLLSATLAILAARPKLIREKGEVQTKERTSLLFFGVIARFTLDQYMQEMDKLVSSDKDMYDTMTIDLYHQGVILTRKYALLSYAYGIFMVGFVVSVFVFLGFLVWG